MLKNVTDTVFYVGVDDKNIDLFENQYIVPNGIAYNSYVIMDEKIAIMDMVDAKCADQWFANVAVNIGLAIVECPEAAEAIEEGHTVEADLDNGILLDQTTGKSFHTAPFPPFIQTIITNGGLIASIKKGAVK